MAEIWSRDDLHATGASEDDARLECEIAYQIISRGQTLGGLIALGDDDREATLDTIATDRRADHAGRPLPLEVG